MHVTYDIVIIPGILTSIGKLYQKQIQDKISQKRTTFIFKRLLLSSNRLVNNPSKDWKGKWLHFMVAPVEFLLLLYGLVSPVKDATLTVSEAFTYFRKDNLT